jgi:hypothetical protein
MPMLRAGRRRSPRSRLTSSSALIRHMGRPIPGTVLEPGVVEPGHLGGDVAGAQKALCAACAPASAPPDHAFRSPAKSAGPQVRRTTMRDRSSTPAQDETGRSPRPPRARSPDLRTRRHRRGPGHVRRHRHEHEYALASGRCDRGSVADGLQTYTEAGSGGGAAARRCRRVAAPVVGEEQRVMRQLRKSIRAPRCRRGPRPGRDRGGPSRPGVGLQRLGQQRRLHVVQVGSSGDDVGEHGPVGASASR